VRDGPDGGVTTAGVGQFGLGLLEPAFPHPTAEGDAALSEDVVEARCLVPPDDVSVRVMDSRLPYPVRELT
jgi:hypothetical protein